MIEKNYNYNFENRVNGKKPDINVSNVNVNSCTFAILAKTPVVDGRFYHTTDTNKFYFDWGGKRTQLNFDGTDASISKEIEKIKEDVSKLNPDNISELETKVNDAIEKSKELETNVNTALDTMNDAVVKVEGVDDKIAGKQDKLDNADVLTGITADDIAGWNGLDEKIENIQLTPGPQGEKGDRGEQGLPGIDGQDGKSAYEIAKDAGFEGSESAWIASLKGEKGERGEKGESGEAGVSGSDGKSAYEIAKELNPEITSESAWISSLKGETGDRGPAGPEGPQGSAGADGKPGDDGASAYEIAKRLDPTIGTETEWIESLKGKDGKDGLTLEQVQTELSGYVKKVDGSGLITDDEKIKLAGIATGAEVNVQADWEEADENADGFIKNKPNIPSVDGLVKETDLETRLGNYVTNEVLDGKGYLTEHQKLKTINGEPITGDGDITITGDGTIDLSEYAKKTDVAIGAFPTVSDDGEVGNVENDGYVKVGNVVAFIEDYMSKKKVDDGTVYAYTNGWPIETEDNDVPSITSIRSVPIVLGQDNTMTFEVKVAKELEIWDIDVDYEGPVDIIRFMIDLPAGYKVSNIYAYNPVSLEWNECKVRPTKTSPTKLYGGVQYNSFERKNNTESDDAVGTSLGGVQPYKIIISKE